MCHRPIEEIGRSIRELINGKWKFQIVGQRFEREENVPLPRRPEGRQIAEIEISFVKMKEKSVAVVELIAVVCGDAVGHFTTGANERFLTESEIHVGTCEKARPVENLLQSTRRRWWRGSCCFR